MNISAGAKRQPLRRSESESAAYSPQARNLQQHVRFYGECAVIPETPSVLSMALRGNGLPAIRTKSVTLTLPVTWGHHAVMQLDHQHPSLPSGSRTCMTFKLPCVRKKSLSTTNTCNVSNLKPCRRLHSFCSSDDLSASSPPLSNPTATVIHPPPVVFEATPPLASCSSLCAAELRESLKSTPYSSHTTISTPSDDNDAPPRGVPETVPTQSTPSSSSTNLFSKFPLRRRSSSVSSQTPPSPHVSSHPQASQAQLTPLRPCCTSCERTLDHFLEKEVPGEPLKWSPGARKKKDKDEQWEKDFASRGEKPGPVQPPRSFDSYIQKQLDEEARIFGGEDVTKGSEHSLRVDEVAVLEERGETRKQLGIAREGDEEVDDELNFVEKSTIEEVDEEAEGERDPSFACWGESVHTHTRTTLQSAKQPSSSVGTRTTDKVPDPTAMSDQSRSRSQPSPSSQSGVSSSLPRRPAISSPAPLSSATIAGARYRDRSSSSPNPPPRSQPPYRSGKSSFWSGFGSIGRVVGAAGIGA
ncbi:uncharacterized protein EI90DRAFT_3063230 [Cantharellus anzutake]|uniref:uncharacterized protein n=1 Tax=Cantharellus anzutake TaxID=1750568 RepID=UPI0019067864|nr:uncharacterized protein EI90DRAFT_3063230 [Cantharellus anzutake]KAF8329118.1 hypothetical protein EI90DRAFT_3063230 [Cantharellus anzutake]